VVPASVRQVQARHRRPQSPREATRIMLAR
jgi:hypothetical protein